jgi:hypothetical protein
VTDSIRPPDPAADFRRALDRALTATSLARVGLHLLERQLDGGDLGADREPLLCDLRSAADRLSDAVRTLTELADAAFGGSDTVVRIAWPA